MTKFKVRKRLMLAAAVALAGVVLGACAEPGKAVKGSSSAAGAVMGESGGPVTFEDLLEIAAKQDGHRARGRSGAWSEPDAINIPVGRIVIPGIGLDVPFRLGVHDAIVQQGPGLWPGTPLPGDPGNAVFAGHRTTYTHPFGDLDLLQQGDVIHTRVPGLGRTVFRVFRTAIVLEAEYAEYVLRQPVGGGARLITLFACTPKGQRTHRIVVQGRALRAEKERGEWAPVGLSEREDER